MCSRREKRVVEREEGGRRVVRRGVRGLDAGGDEVSSSGEEWSSADSDDDKEVKFVAASASSFLDLDDADDLAVEVAFLVVERRTVVSEMMVGGS